MRKQRQGFSLLELAIVITIIALLSGILVAAQSLIRASQLASAISDVGRYMQAVSDFRDKFSAYPGDMPNAESFWGTDPGGCPTPTTGAGGTAFSDVPHKETCNGDGNGLIGPAGVLDYGSYVQSGPGAYEWYRAWQQLSNAGFIDGSFTGINGPASVNNAVIGSNVPATRLPGTGFSLFHVSYPAGNVDWWPIYNHVLVFGRVYQDEWTSGAAITPEEAFAVDQKLDDGLPADGKVMTMTQNRFPDCTTTNVQATSRYNTAYTLYACSLVFNLGY